MKTVKNRWIGRLLRQLIIVLAVGLACGGGADESDTSGRSVSRRPGLERPAPRRWWHSPVGAGMDHTVSEPTVRSPKSDAAQLSSASKAATSISPAELEPRETPPYSEYVNAEDAKVERMGPVGITGETWYVPS